MRGGVASEREDDPDWACAFQTRNAIGGLWVLRGTLLCVCFGFLGDPSSGSLLLTSLQLVLSSSVLGVLLPSILLVLLSVSLSSMTIASSGVRPLSISSGVGKKKEKMPNIQ